MEKPLDNIYSPEASKVVPVWETSTFIEWYLEESKKSVKEQTDGYRQFLLEVAAGRARVPSKEEIARYKIQGLRNKI